MDMDSDSGELTDWNRLDGRWLVIRLLVTLAARWWCYADFATWNVTSSMNMQEPHFH